MSSSKKRRDISKANEAKRQAEIAKGFAEGEVTIWKTGAEIMQHELTQLRTELAATQLQLKEVREALSASYPTLSNVATYLRSKSDKDCMDIDSACELDAVSRKQHAALSRPADTTALNRYVAEELDFAVERVITLYEGDEPPYLVDICKAIKDWNAKKKLCNQYWKFSRGI